MKALLLAGGFGTRLRPLTFTGNKHTLPVANKPIITYGLDALKDAGIKDIGIITGPMGEGIEKIIGNGSSFGVQVTYIFQPEPKGIAQAIGLAETFIGGDPFVVCLGDNILQGGISRICKKFLKSDADELLLLKEIDNLQMAKRFGIAEVKDDKVVRVVEKPKDIFSNLIMIGIYMFRSKVFDAIKELKPSWRGELEITDAIQKLIDWNCKVSPYIITEKWWKDTGEPNDIIEANRLILDDLKPVNRGKVESDVSILGRVSIGSDTIIKSGSVIKGPSIIGKNCEIGPNTYVGPYTSIGDNCTIIGGDVESSIIQNQTTIDCGEKIIDSLIGANVKISNNGQVPKGKRLILGDSSVVKF
ncbi:MAG: glucose-1-phosphate thymidylyltransferase [Thaumarchaeota archaeon]|nr:glucose-1-phosphate thymidylyltransferase [Nitrososphaerota archaeon]MCL5318571.1 glucose-1-phosphate thymidylyltransferase [Nitrososphaerota archaeon]